MITVEQVWKGILPEGTRLLAGAHHVNRIMSWVLVLKPRPPGLDAPRGDELILMSTDALAALDPHITLTRTIQTLAESVSAIAVRGGIPYAAVEESERLNLPLFELPVTVSLTMLERDILRFLSEQSSEWYRKKHSILHELTEIALQGRGLHASAHHMGEITGLAIVFADEQGESLASYVPPAFPERHLETIRAASVIADFRSGSMATRLREKELLVHLDEGLGRLTAPVTVKGQYAGTASVFGPVERLDDQARFILEAGVTAGAIEFAREHAVLETVDRMQGDLLRDLVEGDGDIQAISRRAKRMGVDAEATRVAFTFSPLSIKQGGTNSNVAALASLNKRIALVLTSYGVQAPILVDDDVLTVFYPVEQGIQPAALKLRAERFHRDVSDAIRHHRLYIGISRYHSGPNGFRECFQQSRRALELGRALATQRSITYYGDLGIYRLLFAMRETDEMHEFYQEMLGDLTAYDQEKNTELVSTLHGYLGANSTTEGANNLNLHRNSLRYRLRRIREITRLDLDDPETRLALHLALRVGETLRATHDLTSNLHHRA